MRRLFAVVGPSGVGKDSLIEGACAARPGLYRARRVITRPAEAGGEDHIPATPETFAAMKAAGAFAIDWQAHGLCYGIPAVELDAADEVIFNGSRAVLATAARRFPDLTVLHVTAPAGVLAARLAARGREGQAEILARLQRADLALPTDLPPDLRVVEVVNDGTLDHAVAQVLAAIQAPPVKG